MPENATRKLRTCGSRISWSDAAFLTGMGVLFWVLREALGDFVWIIPMAAGHFFLFCNIIRMRRNYELIWSGIFLTQMILWIVTGALSWPIILLIQIPITVVLVTLEIRSPRYHGIGCRRINTANIERWLSGELN